MVGICRRTVERQPPSAVMPRTRRTRRPPSPIIPTNPSIHSYCDSLAPPPYEPYDPNSHSSETTPLIRIRINTSPENNLKHRRPNCSVAVLILFIPFLLAPLFAGTAILAYRHFSTDILDPAIRDRIRHEWHADEVRHNLKINRLRSEEEELEKEITERRRQEADREWREKVERESMRLYWTDLEGNNHCVSHGVRQYTARLANFRQTIDGVTACKATPIVINGETYASPDHCKDGWGGVYGYWDVRDDPTCTTFWDGLWDKGCTARGSGYRRFEAKLLGLRPEDNGEVMCATTPVTILHQDFDHPVACPFIGWPWSYYQGVWVVPDSHCH